MASAVMHRFRTSVAPMVDVTDPCFLRLLRLISPFGNHQLWTEMIHANAFSRGRIHMDPPKLAMHLPLRELQDFASGIVAQIGAANPDDAHAAVKELTKLGVRHVNLNCGCPSRNVQMGAFGAILMKSPALVSDIVNAMQDAARDTRCHISVKCRIGVDEDESPEFLRRFVSTVVSRHIQGSENPVSLVLHARRAWLKGLSPKQNRTMPVLNHARVHEMVREFPHTAFIINGGIDTADAVIEHLAQADGVMIGRKIREDPWFLSQLDQRVYGVSAEDIPPAAEVLAEYVKFADYIHSQYDTKYSILSRPLFAFFHGLVAGVPNDYGQKPAELLKTQVKLSNTKKPVGGIGVGLGLGLGLHL
ncbi:dihydrouridine synthase [Coemansia reversa NRRL 1564]|uniref:tRNA-dihydrouridine synthase n=1 Tax=Coemansia reversa (strain ATCC 12441 / NRRL 1564) TaxID=763665 RepID=A0A2G5BKM3_COERN|nr:dihydrouridine synthase [Coemansia reversa NRRL 1564]|eukprot:PIA19522.1 dihydrouridine synthase [Coemansia reversa NRRL 1564]